MDLFEHFRTIWRWRWRILTASFAVGAIVLGWSLSLPPVYQATALVGWSPGPTQTFNDTGIQLTMRRLQELAGTKVVLANAVQDSQLPLSADEARERVKVADPGNGGGLLALSATGPSRKDAQRLAQGLVDALIAAVDAQQTKALQTVLKPLQDQMNQIQLQLQSVRSGSAQEQALQARFSALANTSAQLQSEAQGHLDVVSPAAADPNPVNPKPRRNGLLALLVALVVNAELAVVLSARSDRFSGERIGEEAAELVGVPLLAQIPAGDHAAAIEAFRTLRAGIMSTKASRELRLLAVVGVAPRCGTTFVSTQLTEALSGLDIALLLVDANLRTPQLHKIFNIPRSPGISDVVLEREMPAKMMYSVNRGGMVIPCGTSVEDPPAVFSSAQLRKALDAVNDVQLAILDTPSLGAYVDALVIAEQCDGAILVFDGTSTSRTAVLAAANQLRRAGVYLAGVVANKTSGAGRPRGIA